MEFLLVVCVIGAVICGMVLKNVKEKKTKSLPESYWQVVFSDFL